MNIQKNYQNIAFGNTKVNTMYYNDLHGQKKNLESFLNAQREILSGGGG